MDSSGLTAILGRAREGDEKAREEVLPLVYAELRAIARKHMRSGARSHTLQPTALVHEAYLRSLGGKESFENRRHFFFVAARAMRDVLVEHARKKAASKRGGDVVEFASEELAVAVDAPMEDMVAMNDALEALESKHSRPYQVVMLRFFAGMSNEEAAELLEIDPRTAGRDWKFARAFLLARLSPDADG